MIRKLTSLLLSVFILFGCCACGQKAATETAPTWQEQYDLGVRYLSEGNYEEAIIAFTAAIEIEPKRPEGYLGLADAYTGLGDTDAARQALEDGFAATGDESLSARLAELETEVTDEAEEQGWALYDQGVAAYFEGSYTQALELLNGAIAAFRSSASLADDPYGLILSAGAAVRVCYAMGDIHAALDYFAIAEAHMNLGAPYYNDSVFADWGGICVLWHHASESGEINGADYELYEAREAEEPEVLLLYIEQFYIDGRQIVAYAYNGQAEMYENGQPVEDLDYDLGDDGRLYSLSWTSP